MTDFQLAAIAAILIGVVLSIAIPLSIGVSFWDKAKCTPEYYINRSKT